MIRPNLRMLGVVVPLMLAALFAQAAPPSSPPPGSAPESPSSKSTKTIEEYQSLGIDRHFSSFSGMVLDLNDHPISGVQVELLIDGQLAEGTRTDGSGYYDLRAPYDAAADVTVLLWFVAPEHSLMPKGLVLKESKVSQENALISRCVPRATLLPGHQFRVYLFDSASRNKELAELDCLP